MKRFTAGRRVRIVADGPLKGKEGQVHRIRIADNGAWVRMDEDLPQEFRSFTPEDERGNDLILFPEQCEPAE